MIQMFVAFKLEDKPSKNTNQEKNLSTTGVFHIYIPSYV